MALDLPAELNLINDSAQRIKIRIKNKNDKVSNLDPGESLKVSGSKNLDYGTEIDIIINPKGPGNNSYLAEFQLYNPATEDNTAESDNLYANPFANYNHGYKGIQGGPKKTWGLLPGGYALTQKYGAMGYEVNQLVPTPRTSFPLGSIFFGFFSMLTPSLMFEAETSMQVNGAKKLDLYIKTVPDI